MHTALQQKLRLSSLHTACCSIHVLRWSTFEHGTCLQVETPFNDVLLAEPDTEAIKDLHTACCVEGGATSSFCIQVRCGSSRAPCRTAAAAAAACLQSNAQARVEAAQPTQQHWQQVGRIRGLQAVRREPQPPCLCGLDAAHNAARRPCSTVASPRLRKFLLLWEIAVWYVGAASH
jgi:hypothetical protein